MFANIKKMYMQKEKKAFERLLVIMNKLREECPWDKKQTIDTLRHLTIEEVYELSDAILDKDMNEVRNELGDLLLHIVFYSRIASEKDYFNITDVINNVCDKLIHRHPHIYGDEEVKDENHVKENWEKLKLKEGKRSVLEGVPASLPSLIKAFRLQEKAKGVGFDWDNENQVWLKVKEEIEEFEIELDRKSSEKMEMEFGDLLFALVNYARFIGVNPADALERTNKKFIKRFQLMEESIKKSGNDFAKMNLSEMDEYWNQAKQYE